jgi:hypothetical protein
MDISILRQVKNACKKGLQITLYGLEKMALPEGDKFACNIEGLHNLNVVRQ